MAKKSGSSKSNSARPVTRSRAGVSNETNNETLTQEASTKKVADITYYTKMANQKDDRPSMAGKFYIKGLRV